MSLLPKKPWFKLYYKVIRNAQSYDHFVEFEDDSKVARTGAKGQADFLFSNLHLAHTEQGNIFEKGKLVKVTVTVTEEEIS